MSNFVIRQKRKNKRARKKEEENGHDEVRNSKTHYLCNLQACANFEVPSSST